MDRNNSAFQGLQMQMAVDAVRMQLPHILEYVTINAKVRKVKYDALLKEGFTEEQALYIVTNSKPMDT